jgi:hypothetical protein
MQDNPPAVSQIVIAETLMEQFHQVLDSLKREVEGTGPESDSVYIAEGNRVYPAIWEHLDQARAHLAGTGADFSEYDRIRAGADRHIGIWDFQHQGSEQRLLGRAEVYAWKANHDGVERARHACAVLRRLLPEVDWEEVARAADSEAAVSLAPGDAKIKIILAAGAALALIAVWLLLR